MSRWKSKLKADSIDWLLEEDNPSIRYWTLKDLLDKSETEPEVAEAKGKICESKEVKMIFSKSDINGGPFWSKPNGNIYWGLSLPEVSLCFLPKQA